MKRFIVALFLLFGLVFSVRGFAFPITVTATGDNYIYWFYPQQDNGWRYFPYYTSWISAGSAELDYLGGYIYFAVSNGEPPSVYNPAGLLVQIKILDKLIVSDSSWEVAAVEPWTGLPDFDLTALAGLDWTGATWYATNGGTINPEYPAVDGADSDGVALWFEGIGSSIYGISSSAKWIWTDNNFSPDMDDYAVFRVNPDQILNPPDVSPVPEPEPLVMLVMGLLGVFSRAIKRNF